ncbi:hypothetical protein [Amycolatopsis sp. CA-230715]|uniref:hypothetical protein n=1 Tax=Amycolatopsis sp. CA-230715 TaxID=2745196 RepID=UPI001C02A421|nr:hypothetical protein [Amycolatopsis sp. CA-230715]QWF81602.1 hypothetical protein HUW46_05035 [Amycolatopsis sp. CA-230715]
MPDQDTLAKLRAKVPDMTDQAFDAGRAALLAAIAEETHPGVTVLQFAPRGERKRRRVLPFASAAAALALLAGGTAVVLDNIDHGGYVAPASGYATPPPEPTGVDVPLPPMSDKPYNAAADLARIAADPPMPPGSYLYVNARTLQPGNGGPVTDVVTTWVPAGADVDRDWRRTNGGAMEPKTWTARGGEYSPPRGAGGSWNAEGGLSSPSHRFLLNLTRDPKALFAQIAATAGNSAGEFFDLMAEELNDGWMPHDLRAAFFGALAYHPWVTVDKNAHAPDGAAAISLSANRGMMKETLFFDPVYARFIGQRNTVNHVPSGSGDMLVIDPPARPGAKFLESTMDYAVVPSIGAKPQ